MERIPCLSFGCTGVCPEIAIALEPHCLDHLHKSLGLLSTMHLPISLVPLMLAMITLVLSNPLGQPSRTDRKKLEKETINFVNLQRLDDRQVSGYAYNDLLIHEIRALLPANTAPSWWETPTQEVASPKHSGVYTHHGPLITPVGEKLKNRQTAYSTDTVSPSGTPSGTPRQSNMSPGYTQINTPHDPMIMPRSHYWLRRQAPSDVEENDSSAILGAHFASPNKVINSADNHQICGAGSICNSITITGEGNTVHGPFPQGFRDLSDAGNNPRSRHYSFVSPPSPEQSSTISEPNQPNASNEGKGGERQKWSRIENMLHLTRRMAFRGDHSGSSRPILRRRQMESGQLEGGTGSASQTSARVPSNHVTNNQRCGDGIVCNSVLIANGNSNVVHFSPQQTVWGTPQRANPRFSQSDSSSLRSSSAILPA